MKMSNMFVADAINVHVEYGSFHWFVTAAIEWLNYMTFTEYCCQIGWNVVFTPPKQIYNVLLQ